jgi:hypothetical protein
MFGIANAFIEGEGQKEEERSSAAGNRKRETQKRKRGGGHDSHSDGYDVCDFSGD